MSYKTLRHKTLRHKTLRRKSLRHKTLKSRKMRGGGCSNLYRDKIIKIASNAEMLNKLIKNLQNEPEPVGNTYTSSSAEEQFREKRRKYSPMKKPYKINSGYVGPQPPAVPMGRPTTVSKSATWTDPHDGEDISRI